MGGQQSTRKLTIDNDDPANVIKVSDSVVDRLRGNTEAVRNKVDKGATVHPTNTVYPTAVPVGPVPSFYPQYMHEPSQTSLQLRQEKDAVLKKNDAYWQNKINKIEDSHEQANKLMAQEYCNAMNEVKEHFPDTPNGQRKPACQEGKKAVLKCYRQYPTEPMRCAKEVQAFAECVDKHRSAVVANRG